MKLEEIVESLQVEWQLGGLGPETLYGEFAIEVAKRAVAAERERCAKVCWKLAGEYATGIDETGDRAHGKMVAANSCAAAIRHLGDTNETT